MWRTTMGVLIMHMCTGIQWTAAGADTIEQVVRFQIDRPGYLKQYETVFQKPILDGGSALPVGNGDLAAVIWQPGDLTIMLNKCDIGGASQAARLVVQTPDKVASRVGTLESRLSLYDATTHITYEGGKRTCRVAVPWAEGCDLTAKGKSHNLAVKNGTAEFEVEPGVVYTLTPKGKKPSDAAMVDVGFKTQYSPCRLGNVWYGSRDAANNHSSDFPLW